MSPAVAARRAIGVDLGSKRIGIACSDAGRVLASPYSVLERTGDVDRDHARILEIALECEADCIVVGLPTALDGTAGIAAKAVTAEAGALAAAARRAGPIEVVLHDERMTTAIAQRAMIEADVSRAKRKAKIDKVAAAIILQSYLDRPAAHGEPR